MEEEDEELMMMEENSKCMPMMARGCQLESDYDEEECSDFDDCEEKDMDSCLEDDMYDLQEICEEECEMEAFSAP